MCALGLSCDDRHVKKTYSRVNSQAWGLSFSEVDVEICVFENFHLQGLLLRSPPSVLYFVMPSGAEGKQNKFFKGNQAFVNLYL